MMMYDQDSIYHAFVAPTAAQLEKAEHTFCRRPFSGTFSE